MELVSKSRDSLLVTAPVLVPGEKDCEFVYGEEPLTEEKISKIAHEYLANYGLVDKNHEFFKTRESIGVPVESYITSDSVSLKGLDGTVREYPRGTWIATAKITDSDEIDRVLNGEYTGFSVTAVSKKDAEKQIQLPKRVLMKDIEDPVGFTISLVKKPCVDGAHFCSLKGDNLSNNIDDKLEEETKGFLQSIKSILTKDEKEEEPDIESIVNEATKDFMTSDDFEIFKKDLQEDLNKKIELLGSELFKSIKKSLQKEQNAESEEDENTNEEEPEDEKPETAENTAKQSSKSIPNHSTNTGLKYATTGTSRVYEIMGRDNTGSALKTKQ